VVLLCCFCCVEQLRGVEDVQEPWKIGNTHTNRIKTEKLQLSDHQAPALCMYGTSTGSTLHLVMFARCAQPLGSRRHNPFVETKTNEVRVCNTGFQ
jgi:hypothetical protein